MDDSVAGGEAEKTASCEAEQGKEEIPMEEDKGTCLCHSQRCKYRL